MESFEHYFENKVFKLTMAVYQRDCLLWFEIFDDNNVYLKSLGYPFNKNRVDELFDCVKGRDQLDDIKSFYFGMDNKSYLLFTGNGILIGQLKNPNTGIREEFQVSALSGLALTEYLLQMTDNSHFKDFI